MCAKSRGRKKDESGNELLWQAIFDGIMEGCYFVQYFHLVQGILFIHVHIWSVSNKCVILVDEILHRKEKKSASIKRKKNRTELLFN